MAWIKAAQIIDFNNYNYWGWEETLRKGYLIYFSENGKILIRKVANLFEKKELTFDCIHCYASNFGEDVFIALDNRLIKTDFDLSYIKDICKTPEERISILNEVYCLGRTVSRQPRISRSEIISSPDCKVVYKWEDRSFIVHSDANGLFLFEDFFDGTLRRVDIQTGEDVWEFKMNRRFPGARFYKQVSDNLLLTIEDYDTEHPVDKRYELLGIDLETGKLIYRSQDSHFWRYVYSEAYGKLFGIHGQTFQAVDPHSGKILSRKKIEGLESFVSGNQSITDNYLYFATMNPEVGCFNLDCERLEYIQKIKVDETKVSMRRPLNDRPVVIHNKLFVKDNSGVLHIYEKIIS